MKTGCTGEVATGLHGLRNQQLPEREDLFASTAAGAVFSYIHPKVFYTFENMVLGGTCD